MLEHNTTMLQHFSEMVTTCLNMMTGKENLHPLSSHPCPVSATSYLTVMVVQGTAWQLSHFFEFKVHLPERFVMIMEAFLRLVHTQLQLAS